MNIKTYEPVKKETNTAKSIFINWELLAQHCAFDYHQELKDQEITEEFLINKALNKTKKYVSKFDNELDETEILKIENNYLAALRDHWSLQKIITSHVNFKKLTEQLNCWAQKGPKNKDLFGLSPKTGFAIDYFLNKFGIWFTIFEPFLIPYMEIFYDEYRSLPEWNFEDLIGTDIIETYLLLEIQSENPTIIDLSTWMEKFNG